MKPELWDQYSKSTYDRVENPEEEKLENMLRMRMEHIPVHCGTVLDAGCSVGWTTNWMHQHGREAWGISYNAADIVEAKKRGYKQVLEMDMHDLSYFEDGTFDCVFCSHALEHALAPHIVLCEFNRVLAEQGTLIIILPDEHWRQSYTHSAHVNWWGSDQLIFFVETRGFKNIDSWQEATNVRTKYGARGNDLGLSFEKTKNHEGS